MYSEGITDLGIRDKVYDVLDERMEYESKNRWMKMGSWD